MRVMIVVVIFLVVALVSGGPILGIDMGSDTMKVVLSHRNNMDILLDEQSSRKTPSLVGFRRDDRYFGKLASDAIRWVPDNVYGYLRDILGKTSLDDPFVKEVLRHVKYGDKIFINSSVEDFPFLSIKHDDETEYSAVELVAMMFEKIGEGAQKEVGFPVKDVVITVPTFFTQRERTALIEAANLAKFNVLTLMDQSSAVALTYARKYLGTFEEAKNVVFIDAGQSDLTLSLYNMSNSTIYSKVKSKRMDAIQFNPLLRQWNNKIGGREYDLRLFKLIESRILEKFNLKELPPKTERYMMRTIQKLKETLSANKETTYRAEGVINDQDFSTVITREDFEDACSDLFLETGDFVTKFLEQAGLKPEDVFAFEMVGGSGRLPGVQQEILSRINRENLDLHLNGDESAAFGATIFGKIRNSATPLKLKDNIEWPAVVEVLDISTPEGDEPLSKKAVLFPLGSRLSAKKKIDFPHDRPFTVELKYSECDECPTFPGEDMNIVKYEISGFPEEGEYNMTKIPSVTVILQLTTSGTFELVKSEAEIEYMYIPQPKAVIPADNEENENATVEEAEESQEEGEEEYEDDQEDNNTDPERQNVENEETEETEDLTPIEKKRVIKLTVKEINKHKIPSALRFESTLKLSALQQAATLKIRTSARRNDVEALIFSTRDELAYDEVLIRSSTEEEREKVQNALTEVSEWFDDEGYKATIEECNQKINTLKGVLKPIQKRITENKNIPEKIEECRKTISLSQELMVDIFEIRKVSDEEKEELDKLCEDTEKYITDIEEKFNNKAENEDLELIRSSEISIKCKKIATQTKIYQKRPRRPVEIEDPEPTEPTESDPEDPEPTESTESDPEDPEPTEDSGPTEDPNPTDSNHEEPDKAHPDL